MDINNYNKISEQITILGNNASLRMCTVLTRKTQEGYKKSFYNEYEYGTEKYVDASSMRTIKKDYDYFLSLEIFDTKDNVILRTGDVFRLKLLLKDIYKFYNDNSYDILFDKSSTKISKVFRLNNLPMGRYVSFKFCFINLGDDTEELGLRISISDDSYTDCTMNDLFGLLYTMDSLNMFQSAQIAVSSLHIELETNLNIIGDTSSSSKVNHNIEERNQQELLVSKKRQLPKKQSRSFFDKMDDM